MRKRRRHGSSNNALHEASWCVWRARRRVVVRVGEEDRAQTPSAWQLERGHSCGVVVHVAVPDATSRLIEFGVTFAREEVGEQRAGGGALLFKGGAPVFSDLLSHTSAHSLTLMCLPAPLKTHVKEEVERMHG